MAIRDWNNNGDKNDAFDNMMDYQSYKAWEKIHDENKGSGKTVSDKSDASGIEAIAITAVSFFLTGFILVGLGDFADKIPGFVFIIIWFILVFVIGILYYIIKDGLSSGKK